MRLAWASDRSIFIEVSDEISFQSSRVIWQLTDFIYEHYGAECSAIRPAYGSILVEVKPSLKNRRSFFMNFESSIAQKFQMISERDIQVEKKSIFEVPVLYGGDFGPDLLDVSRQVGLSIEEIIDLHTSVIYDVAFIGFSPGFPYLIGLPKKLAVGRKARPRSRVPAGSVAIADTQTGIYSLESAGGWNILGRTPLKMFDCQRKQPCLLRPGDKVRFVWKLG